MEVVPEEIDAALPQVVAKLTTPLLRRFSFFDPPDVFYEEELKKLLNREVA